MLTFVLLFISSFFFFLLRLAINVQQFHLSLNFQCSFLPKFSIHIETKYEDNCGSSENVSTGTRSGFALHAKTKPLCSYQKAQEHIPIEAFHCSSWCWTLTALSLQIFGQEKSGCDLEVDFLDIAYDKIPERHYESSEVQAGAFLYLQTPPCFTSLSVSRYCASYGSV